jgi:hypothetical protein
MAKNSAPVPLEVSGPRKRKLSSKASTNGDPLVQAPKRKKLTNAVKTRKDGTAALTQKKKPDGPSKTDTGTSKAATNRAFEKTSGKRTQKRATVEDVDDPDDERTSNPPQNPNHILEAADGSDNDSDPAPEIISIASDDDNSDDEEANLEEAEESAEAELGRNFISVSN